MIDLEHELGLALREATDDLVADDALLWRLPRPGATHWRRGGLLLGAAAAAAAVVAASSLLTGAEGTHRTRPVIPGGDLADWGPPRGDLGGDPALAAKLLAEWNAPQGRGRDGAFPSDRTTQLRVLWAGTTAVGAAAFAVDDATGLVGAFGPGPRLIWRGTPQDAPGGVDKDGLVLSPDAEGRYVVVVPLDESATVRVSSHHDVEHPYDPRTFATLPLRDGSAQVDLGTTAQSRPRLVGDELVQVVDHGAVVVDSWVGASTAPLKDILTSFFSETDSWTFTGTAPASDDLHPMTADPGLAAWRTRHHLDPGQLVYSAEWGTDAESDLGPLHATMRWLPGQEAVLTLTAGDRVVHEAKMNGFGETVLERIPELHTTLAAGAKGNLVTAWAEHSPLHRFDPHRVITLLGTDTGSLTVHMSNGETAGISP